MSEVRVPATLVALRMVFLIAALCVLFVVLSALTGALLFSRWKLAYGDRSSFVTHRRSIPSENINISFRQRAYRRVRDPVCFSGDSNDLRGWIFFD